MLSKQIDSNIFVSVNGEFQQLRPLVAQLEVSLKDADRIIEIELGERQRLEAETKSLGILLSNLVDVELERDKLESDNAALQKQVERLQAILAAKVGIWLAQSPPRSR